jgi:predicted NACHT family NTPase
MQGTPYCPVTDEAYVTLFVHRIQEDLVTTTVTERISDQYVRKTQVERRPKMDQVPFAQLLSRPERIVCVTGDGGSGKTTALRRLAYHLADEGLTAATKVTLLPVVLKASELAASSDRLVAIAGQATAKLSANDAACFTAQDLSDGNVVLFVDALDEVVGTECRAAVLEKIIEFREQFGKCLVIVTTRQYSSIRQLTVHSLRVKLNRPSPSVKNRRSHFAGPKDFQ